MTSVAKWKQTYLAFDGRILSLFWYDQLLQEMQHKYHHPLSSISSHPPPQGPVRSPLFLAETAAHIPSALPVSLDAMFSSSHPTQTFLPHASFVRHQKSQPALPPQPEEPLVVRSEKSRDDMLDPSPLTLLGQSFSASQVIPIVTSRSDGASLATSSVLTHICTTPLMSVTASPNLAEPISSPLSSHSSVLSASTVASSTVSTLAEVGHVSLSSTSDPNKPPISSSSSKPSGPSLQRSAPLAQSKSSVTLSDPLVGSSPPISSLAAHSLASLTLLPSTVPTSVSPAHSSPMILPQTSNKPPSLILPTTISALPLVSSAPLVPSISLDSLWKSSASQTPVHGGGGGAAQSHVLADTGGDMLQSQTSPSNVLASPGSDTKVSERERAMEVTAREERERKEDEEEIRKEGAVMLEEAQTTNQSLTSSSPSPKNSNSRPREVSPRAPDLSAKAHSPPPPAKTPSSNDGIDPLMLKYMEMVQQQRQASKQVWNLLA